MQRSSASWRSAVAGSKRSIVTNVDPAARQALRITSELRWQNGSGSQKRSLAAISKRSPASVKAVRVRPSWLSTQPFGWAVVPEV